MSVFSFRITTNGVLRNYRANLNQSYGKLNSASIRVMTGRRYNTYAEDPGAASRAFQLRRSLWRADDQLTNTKNAYSKFQTAYSAVGFICDGNDENPGLDGIKASLATLNDTNATARDSLARELEGEAEGVLQLLNITYAGDFVFAGADGKNVPFSWGEDANGNRILLYRGVNVDETGPSGDATYVDIGLGLQEDENGPVPTSAYNTALDGLDFIGYGTDEDGDPRNVVSLMLKMADLCRDYNEEDASRIFGKLEKAINKVGEARVELTSKAGYLQTNIRLLNNTADTLNEQREDLENINPAQAITEMSYASYCYNAALRIGNTILSQSLLDYMK